MCLALLGTKTCQAALTLLLSVTMQLQVYELVNKTAAGIVPSSTFSPQNQLVAPNRANGNQMMMLQFFRPYDSTFQRDKIQVITT